MIKLQVEHYCHNCKYFEVEVVNRRKIIESYDFMSSKNIDNVEGDLIITCKHYEKCTAIEKYVKECIKK